MHEMVVHTAYHEAGHAVRTWWLRRGLDEVWIDQDHPGEGFCESQTTARQMLRAGVPVNSVHMRDDVSICLAGPLAEMRYRRIPLRGTLAPTGNADLSYAWEVVTLWEQARYGHADDIGLGLFLIQRDTKRFLRRPKAWRAVEAVAAALLMHGHLGGEEAEQIIEAAYGRYGFPRHWRQPFEWSDPRIGSLLETRVESTPGTPGLPIHTA
jgi:hypothetical protein